MACVVPSRFASLKIVEDDFVTSKIKEANKEKKNEQAKALKKTDDKKTKSTSKNKQVVNKMTATSNNGSQGKKRHPPPSVEQWEEWKQKDNQLVAGNYEDDLSQAILLSKLDFEEKKKVYKSNKKESDTAKKLEEQLKAQGNKKLKKNKTMSLGQFNGLSNENVDPSIDEESEEPDESFQECRTFFDRVKRDATDELVRENLNRCGVRLPSKTAGREPPSNDEIKGSKLLGVLEKKDKEIQELKTEVDNLKTELLKVKSRNKKLCSIIGQGEMKDKAEVLVEVERLREVQAELTGEVASLHAQLEQQKSKGSTVRTDSKHKETKKKKLEKES